MKVPCEFSMKIERNAYLLLSIALSAALGAAIAAKLLRRHPTAHPSEHAPHLKSWENEGGNLAPSPSTSALP